MPALNDEGYSLRPVQCHTAGEVVANAAKVRSFRELGRKTPFIPIVLPTPRLVQTSPSFPKWPPIKNLGQCRNDYANSAGYQPAPPVRCVRIRDIQRAVCRHFSITMEDLLSSRRTQNVARPRHIAVWIAKKATLKSLPEIGRAFANRDHSTALNSIRRIDQCRVVGDPEVLSAIGVIGIDLGITRLLERV